MTVQQGPTTLRQALDELARQLPGLEAAAVVGMDGIAIEQRLSGGAASFDRVAAGQTSLLKEAAALCREADGGEPQELVLATDRRLFVARVVARDYFLLLVAPSSASLGRLRFAARRAARGLEQELR
jgi:predicted regulator of Ras-like GTPase activity (Roadblock/LC7/MglB family)